MSEYPSNSRNVTKSQEPQKKSDSEPEKKQIKRVVEGGVTRRKEPFGRRFLNAFGGEDASSVGSYLVHDVLIPAFKDTITDMVQQGIERMVYGESSRRRPSGGSAPSRGGSTQSYTSYSSRYNSGPARREEPRRGLSNHEREMHNFDQIILDHKVEADEIIDQMFTLLDQYKVVSVADLYSMLGETSEFTDQNWGWYDLSSADILRVKGGYRLRLPRPTELRG